MGHLLSAHPAKETVDGRSAQAWDTRLYPAVTLASK